MFCKGCRAEVPAGAVVCWSCGRHLGVDAPTSGPREETCEIKFSQASSFTAVEGYFFAEAYGTAGARTLAFSPRFPPPFRDDSDRVAAALESLTLQLLQDGWERMADSTDNWYSRRFRRSLS